MMDTFPCTKCGACCKSIEGIDFLKEYNKDGICTQLVNNICNIYEERPLLCRIDEAYDHIFFEYMSKEEYYQSNAKACNILQEKKGISESYRVVIG